MQESINANNKIESAVVTGPTGVIGLALSNYLSEIGVETYLICHSGSKRNETLPESKYIHKVYCNLDHLDNLTSQIDHVDAFFHLGWVGTQDRENRMNMHLQNTNIGYALDAADVAAKLRCKVFVGAGSQAEFGNVSGVIHSDQIEHPVTGYGMAKLCAGQMTREMCHEKGIRHIWPRIVSVYGPNDGKSTLINSVVYSLLDHKIPDLTPGEQVWDYLYSKDAAKALYAMAESGKDGAKYVLGSGQTRHLKDFMYDIRDAVSPSAELGIGNRPYLPNQVMHLEADISELTKDTGWSPETSFEDGIKETVKIIRGGPQSLTNKIILFPRRLTYSTFDDEVLYA